MASTVRYCQSIYFRSENETDRFFRSGEIAMQVKTAFGSGTKMHVGARPVDLGL